MQTRSALQQAFKFLVNPNAPVCGGSFRNLTIDVPAGSCFDPSPTAACLHYGPHLMLAMDLTIRALSEALPERTAPATSATPGTSPSSTSADGRSSCPASRWSAAGARTRAATARAR